MKRQVIAALTVGLVLLLAAEAAVSAGGPDIPWWVIAGGGDSANGGTVTLSDTLGQPIIGTAAGSTAGGTVELDAGYWQRLYGPAAVTALHASVVVDTQRKVRLEWTKVGSDTVGHTIAGVTYDVYREADAPYFTPGLASVYREDWPDATLTDPDAAVLTATGHGMYYVVVAVYNGLPSTPSDHTGAFVFALTPGG